MITVNMPDTYRRERCYVLDFVFKQVLGLEYEPVFRTDNDASVTFITLPNNHFIVVEDILFQTPENDWLAGSVIPVCPLPRVVIDDEVLSEALTDPELPILFAGEAIRRHSRSWEQNNPESLKVHFDLLGSIFFMLSRYEEVASPVLDNHQRYDSRSSLAVINGFEMRPLVDEYVALLRRLIQKLDPSVICKRNVYSVNVTHDLDRPFRFVSFPLFIKGFLAHLLKRRDWRLATEWLMQGLWRTRGSRFDPFFAGMETLLSITEKYGLRSQINVMGSMGGLHDEGYDAGKKPLRVMLSAAGERGHSIGFHPGYHTYNDSDRFAAEKQHVEDSLGVKVCQIRQHYLRMEVPSTWRIWQQNCILGDGTLGFPDRNGFRAGTCHTYPLFDLENRCELNVRETPLIVMDGALKADFNEALEPDQAADKAIHLANLCKKYGGTFSLLWHNSSLHGDWSGWERVYETIVKHSVELIDG